MSKVKFMAKPHGDQQEVDINLETLRAAKAAGTDVRSYINRTYKTEAQTDTFTQMCIDQNIFFKANKELGIVPPTLNRVFEATANNVQDAVPASHILFPPAILAAVDDKMEVDLESPVQAFDKLVATTTTISGSRAEQPRLVYDGPGGPEDQTSRATRTAQGAEPDNFLMIKARDTSRTIPTLSLGIKVTDQALQGTTLDFLALTIARQRSIASFLNAGDALSAMILGDQDNGDQPLVAKAAQTYDPTGITKTGQLTQTAWLNFLYQDILRFQPDWVIVDSIDTARIIQNRDDKPTISTDDPKSPRIDVIPAVMYPSLAQNIKTFIAPKEWGLASGTILGIQSNVAIAKIINAQATYDAAERFAMNRTQALRFDFGEDYFRIYDEAFSLMTLGSLS